MQIKIMRHTLELKRLTMPSPRVDVEQFDLSCITGGNGRCHCHFGKRFDSCL